MKGPWLVISRVVLALLGIVCCGLLIIKSATIGYSRLLTTAAIVQSNIQPADQAVRLTPKDPEAHYTRALALVNAEKLSEAVAELQQAIRLRPHHYYQWLDLGVTLDRSNDSEGAMQALQRSIELAPAFAQTRWQMGNLLYRQGSFDRAFGELRLGVRSNSNFMGQMLDLAWVASDGNVADMRRLIDPQTGRDRLEFALSLVRHGKATDAAQELKPLAMPVDREEIAILREIVAELIAARNFSEAYSVWTIEHKADSRQPIGLLLNGNFLDPVAQNDPGFGWHLPQVANVSVSIDVNGPNPGSRSLLLQFSGESVPATPVITQLILVNPNTKYSLEFASRVENIVTGGPLKLVVLDASSGDMKTLGQSPTIAVGTQPWNSSRIDFSTGSGTSGVWLAVLRDSCSQNPCPIFGALWLGKFSLVKA